MCCNLSNSLIQNICISRGSILKAFKSTNAYVSYLSYVTALRTRRRKVGFLFKDIKMGQMRECAISWCLKYMKITRQKHSTLSNHTVERQSNPFSTDCGEKRRSCGKRAHETTKERQRKSKGEKSEREFGLLPGKQFMFLSYVILRILRDKKRRTTVIAWLCAVWGSARYNPRMALNVFTCVPVRNSLYKSCKLSRDTILKIGESFLWASKELWVKNEQSFPETYGPWFYRSIRISGLLGTD